MLPISSLHQRLVIWEVTASEDAVTRIADVDSEQHFLCSIKDLLHANCSHADTSLNLIYFAYFKSEPSRERNNKSEFYFVRSYVRK